MDDIQLFFSQQLTEKQLKYITDYDEKLPSFLFIDRLRLRQIIVNLMSNAIKFTEKGYVKIQVIVNRFQKEKNTIDFTVAVEDTGIGIPRKALNDIFDIFRQHDNKSTRKYGGTGLGLAISKRLVEMMGGKISVKSEPGKGSIFMVDFFDIEVKKAPANRKSARSQEKLARRKSFPAKETAINNNAKNLSRVIDKLENDFMKDWKEICQRHSFDEIRDFAAQIKTFALNNQITGLYTFGDKLTKSVESFDVDEINRLLNSYHSVITDIKQQITI